MNTHHDKRKLSERKVEQDAGAYFAEARKAGPQNDLLTLDDDSKDELDKRIDSGDEILGVAWGDTPEGDDREAAAKDAISNVLTTMFGPAGTYSVDGALRPNRYALNEASRLVSEALESWQGDAEDYTRTA